MKLLLDENLPIKMRNDFPNHEVYSVNYKKWNGIKNGELLKLMLSEYFDALITFDKIFNTNKIFLSTLLQYLFYRGFQKLTKH
jgi:predicted nuclease of predicted toxin-antitoxin system